MCGDATCTDAGRLTVAKSAVVKAKTVYTCSECGAQSPKWAGQCSACNAWNTLLETVEQAAGAHRYQSLAKTSPVQRLAQIEASDVPRFSTGIGEFDRVLGGGLVAGGVVLPAVRWLYDYAWFVGFLVAGAVYVILMQRAPSPARDLLGEET